MNAVLLWIFRALVIAVGLVFLAAGGLCAAIGVADAHFGGPGVFFIGLGLLAVGAIIVGVMVLRLRAAAKAKDGPPP